MSNRSNDPDGTLPEAPHAAQPRTAQPLEAEWLTFIRTHRRLMQAYMGRVTRDPDERADLVQCALVVAWNTRSSALDGPDAARWVIRCCRTARQEWARGNRVARRAVQAAVEDGPRDDLRHDFPDDQAVWNLITVLPPRQREAIIYRIAFSFSIRETAAVMHCKEGTVKAHVHAGLRSLKERSEVYRDDLGD